MNQLHPVNHILILSTANLMKLDVQTLEAVLSKAVEFARREWRSGSEQRSDAITDFISDINDMINDAKLQKEIRSQEFKQTLSTIRESFKLMKDHCTGCSTLIIEGPRTYESPSDTDENGVCKLCHKPKYKKQ